MGDKAISEVFEKQFPKHYPWTNKHIEKRRSYLRIKRTKAEEHAIRVKNNGDGRQKKSWIIRGAAKELDLRQWNGRLFIKVNGRFVDYYRFITQAKRGQVVRHHEGTIKVIDRSQNARLNAMQRAALPSDLKLAIRELNRLNKLLNGKENSGFTRDFV